LGLREPNKKRKDKNMIRQAGKILMVVIVLAAVMLVSNGEIGMLAFHNANIVIPHVIHVMPDIPHPITMHPIVHLPIIHLTDALTRAQRHLDHIWHMKHLAHEKHLAYIKLGK
jgi:predicted permease